MAKPPTSAEAIGLIQSYHDWYRPPGCGKKYKKEELVADLLTRVRPIGDGFVWGATDWSSDGTRRKAEPHDSDIMAMGALSVSKLMKLCEALDAYYTITPSARRNTVSVNRQAMEGFMKRDGARWVNIKPEFMWDSEAKEAKMEEKPVGKREAKKAEMEADFQRAVAEAPVGPPPPLPPKKLEVEAPVPPEEEEVEAPVLSDLVETDIDTERLSFDDREKLSTYDITFVPWVFKGKMIIPDEKKPDRYYEAHGSDELANHLWRAYGPFHDEIPWKYQGVALPDGSINTDPEAPILEFDNEEDEEKEKDIKGNILKTTYSRFLNMLDTAVEAPYNDRRDKILLSEKNFNYGKYVKDENRDMEKANGYIKSMEDAIIWQETKALYSPKQAKVSPFKMWQKENPKNRWGRSSNYGDYIVFKNQPWGPENNAIMLSQLKNYFIKDFLPGYEAQARGEDKEVMRDIRVWLDDSLGYGESDSDLPDLINKGRFLLVRFFGDGVAEE